ncbi:MAG: hypothetical protein ACK562_04925, partial [Acidobacteriota bacterium]
MSAFFAFTHDELTTCSLRPTRNIVAINLKRTRPIMFEDTADLLKQIKLGEDLVLELKAIEFGDNSVA